MEDVKQLKIGIAGLGLIGGSILKALSDKGYYTIAVSKSSHTKAKNIADEAGDDFSLLKEADVVFVCSKMSETLAILDKLETIVSKKTLVVDVCSLKSFVCNKERPYNFIGSHPMAGTEFSGFENSFKELFLGARWVLTKENNILETIITDMGANTVYMNPNEHDRAACMISHFPMLLGGALVESSLPDAKFIASSGFRDTTRLAMTDADLAYDMLCLNRDNIEKYTQEIFEKLKSFYNLSEEEFKARWNNIAKQRHLMYDKNGKNCFKVSKED